MYPIADIRKKFKDTFPSIKSIVTLNREGQSRTELIDKAPRTDIIFEFIDEITKKGKLSSTLKGIRQETETRKKAVTPASANYPPVGVGGTSK